jgi:nuclear transport factor 2 (NTF2) superfamily protein
MRTIILIGEIMTDERPPFPPFDEASAWKKVLGAEAAWNSRDPEKVAGAYSIDSVWRNRDTFLEGREQIRDFLTEKWDRETEYALRKDLWAFHGNRIAVRFQYESLDESGQWWRSYGNENWEFDEHGLMRRREASINDVAIDESEKRLFGPREAGDTSVFPLR